MCEHYLALRFGELGGKIERHSDGGTQDSESNWRLQTWKLDDSHSSADSQPFCQLSDLREQCCFLNRTTAESEPKKHQPSEDKPKRNRHEANYPDTDKP